MISRRFALSCALLALVGCGDGAAPAAAAPRAFAVGVITRTFVDDTRPTPANGDAPALATRTLPTEVWYPTPGAVGAELARDAAVDRAHGPYPLVLFVHGSSGGRNQSTFLTRAIAAAGYVVAAADFPLTALSTPGGASDLHVGDQLDDLRVLADRVTALSDDAASPLAGAVRRDQVAVIGHSTGGTLALLAAYAPDRHDARVRGAVALAPCACFFGESLFATRSLPLLVITGSNDLFVPPANNGARAYALAPAPKTYASLVGGNHLFFTDFPVPDRSLSPMPTTAHDAIAVALAAYGGGTACDPTPPGGTDEPLTPAAQHDHTVAIVRAFLDDLFGVTRGALPGIAAVADPLVRWQRP